MNLVNDIAYAGPGNPLTLDLYLPDGPGPHPVVLFFHGGGWIAGDKTLGAAERFVPLTRHGLAVASTSYRLATEAPHPAQLHDAKAAIRWLRGHGAEHGLATARIGAWGASAGAWIASMVGLTAGDADLEGEVGSDRSQSSDVQVVVSWFGPSDLISNASRSWLEREILAPPFEERLLEGQHFQHQVSAARAASPLYRVTPQAPPFLIAHGDRDRVTPVSESLALHDALTRAGVASTALLVGGAGHEGVEFNRSHILALTASFLVSHLAVATGTANP